MKKMFVNSQFQLKEKRDDKIMLHMELKELGKVVLIRVATLSCYFEEQLKEMVKKEYSNKKVHIRYRSDIAMDYFSFREFKRIVFGN